MKSILPITAMAVALSSHAYALQECVPSKEDQRVRYCTYHPNQIVHIWTAPGGTMEIQLAETEFVPEGNIMRTDGSRLEIRARGNFIYIKNTAAEHDTPCMVPEPLLFTTKLPNGGLRPYRFEIETDPNHCEDTPGAMVEKPQPPSAFQLTSAANAAPTTPRVGNLRYVKEGGLAAGANVFYAAIFKYPGDEAAKRRAAEEARAAAAQKQEAHQLLKQQVSWPYGNQWDGTWNFKYAAHGNMVAPAQVRDNGYQTVFLLPQMQRVPSFYRWLPGAVRCNRDHDEHSEATAIPSVHRSGADGDTSIFEGTAQGWCLRDGATVLEVVNFAYNPAGATPATGTVSPYVRRTIRDAPEPEEVPPPPMQMPPQSQEQQPQQQPAPQAQADATIPPTPVAIKKVEGDQPNVAH